jgi:ligand-binding SRPBCC domain-containing protein
VKLYFKTKVKGSVEEVFSKFDKDLFLKLKPPGVSVHLKRFDGCQKGDVIQLELLSPLGKQMWDGKITEWYSSKEECYFIDEGVKLPFPLNSWKHKHLIKNENGETVIIDDIVFSISPKVLIPFFYPVLWSVFKYRAPLYKRIFV